MLFSASAFAAPAIFDVNAAPAQPAVYAAEIIATAAVPVTLSGTSFKVQAGDAIAVGAVRYVRVSLDNGSTFGAVSVASTANCKAGTSVTGQGTNTITFSVTGDAAACTAATAADFVTVTSNIKIVSTAAPTNLAYSLHFDAPAAAAGTGVIFNKTVSYLTFAPSFKLTAVAGLATADFAATVPFSKFTGAKTFASFSTLTLVDQAAAALNAAGDASTLSAVLKDTTTLVVNGDFSAVAGADSAAKLKNVFLATDNTCLASSSNPATVLTASAATFAIGNVTNTGKATLCYVVNGTTPIPVQVYDAVLKAVSADTTTYAVADITASAIGKIAHNGSTLQAPLFQTTAGYISRFVLTNTSTVPVAYAAAVKGEDANVITIGAKASGTIPANGMVVVAASDIATFSGNPRGFAVFDISGSDTSVAGVFQIVNVATGSVSNTTMVRPGQ
jgi:hypothetical protein